MFRTEAHLYVIPSGVIQTRKSKDGASVFALIEAKRPLLPLPCLAMGRLTLFDRESLRAAPVKSGSEDPFFIQPLQEMLENILKFKLHVKT